MVDVVQERGEPHLLIPLRCVTYPPERTGHAGPALCLCPERVLLRRIPFGQLPSLHPLRHRSRRVVRGLPRYFAAVRLPRSVHRRRLPLGFPTRPTVPLPIGRPWTSRFPCMMFPDVLGVSDRAGLPCVSRSRHTGCGLPRTPTVSAPRRKGVSQLNTRPARTPIDASVLPLRAVPHDSGPVWIATPSPYDSFIHYTMPV